MTKVPRYIVAPEIMKRILASEHREIKLFHWWKFCGGCHHIIKKSRIFGFNHWCSSQL